MSSENAFAKAFGDAVDASGITLDRLRHHLEEAGVGVSAATLSYWRSGRSLPTRVRSRGTLAVLEDILDLPAGRLSDLASSVLERTPNTWREVMPIAELAEELMKQIGVQHRYLNPVWIHDTTHIGPDRSERRLFTRQVLRADREDVRTWAVVFVRDSEHQIAPEIVQARNCRVGRTLQVPEERLLVAEMVLPRSLSRGELALVEYTVEWAPDPAPSFRAERACRPSFECVAMDVMFDPDCLPKTVVAYRRPSFEAPESEVTELGPVMVVDDVAQTVQRGVTEGLVGLKWTWD